MHTAFSFIGLIFYVVLVIGLAAAVTLLVVRISPTKDKHPAKSP